MILRLFAILTLSVALYGCSPYHYTKRAKKSYERALKHVPEFRINEKDTVYYRDTVRIKDVHGRDSLIYITNTVTVPCPEPDFSKVKTRWIVRQENKTERRRQKEKTKRTKSNNKTEVKTNKRDNKTARVQSRQENKRPSLWLLLIGVVIGYLIRWGLQKKFGV